MSSLGSRSAGAGGPEVRVRASSRPPCIGTYAGAEAPFVWRFEPDPRPAAGGSAGRRSWPLPPASFLALRAAARQRNAVARHLALPCPARAGRDERGGGRP